MTASKNIEVEFSVLADSEVAEANHSLQAVTQVRRNDAFAD